jgi:hypothetical protein
LKGDHVFVLPYASCLSTFRAPGWGMPAVLPPCRWRNATPWELVPFSHRSTSRIFIMQPGCTPRRRSPKTVTSSSMAGENKPGCGLCPSLSLKDFHHWCWGGECAELGRPLRGRWPAPSLSDGGKALRRSWRWQLPRVRLSDPSGFGAIPSAAFRHGSWKRFFRRRDSRDRPRTDLQLYGLLPVLASRVWARAGASWQQYPP